MDLKWGERIICSLNIGQLEARPLGPRRYVRVRTSPQPQDIPPNLGFAPQERCVTRKSRCHNIASMLAKFYVLTSATGLHRQ